jgi:hypothetical protein
MRLLRVSGSDPALIAAHVEFVFRSDDRGGKAVPLHRCVEQHSDQPLQGVNRELCIDKDLAEQPPSWLVAFLWRRWRS